MNQNTTPKTNKSLYYSIIGLGIGLLVLAVIILWGMKFFELAQTTPSKPSQPAIGLSENAATFKISGGENYPKFLEISFDPFEAKGGESQKLVVLIKDLNTLKSVYAEVEDEIGKRELELTLIKEEENKTYWQGEWDIKLTKEKEYPITFYAENEAGEKSQIVLLWQAKEGGKIEEQGMIDLMRYGFKELRKKWGIDVVLADYIDSSTCTSKDHFPHAGEATLEANISLGASITGIDGGSLTVADGKTLQLFNPNVNVTFVYNPGQRIIPIGKIAIGSGAKIVKGYLWMKDADNDGCGKSINDVTWTTSATSPGSGWKRVKDLSYYPDPDDSNPGDPPDCVPVCECTSGPCCDGCNYRSSTYVCDTWTETDYGCPWGTDCGDDVGVRTRTNKRYCSGTSASCNGTVSYGSWSSWSVADNCSSDEKCADNDPTCNYDSRCAVTEYLNCGYDANCNDVCGWYNKSCIRVEDQFDRVGYYNYWSNGWCYTGGTGATCSTPMIYYGNCSPCGGFPGCCVNSTYCVCQ
jgi:hypothetical protein